MPKNRHFTKSQAKDRNSSNGIQHSSSNRKQISQSPQIKSILKNVNLNEYMSAVADSFKSSKQISEKELDDKNNESNKNMNNGDVVSVRFDDYTPCQTLMEGSEGPTCSKLHVLKKHVKFSDVVQSFSIGDGWKMSIFVEKLKSEADQQDRSKKLRDSYRHYMTKFNPLPKGL